MRVVRANGDHAMSHVTDVAWGNVFLLVANLGRGNVNLRVVAGVFAILASSFVAACGSNRSLATQPAASHAFTPSELLPEDLDFVVRVDAARLRQNPMLVGVVKELAKSRDAGVFPSVKGALASAKTVWVGIRLMSDGFHGDGVIAVEGEANGDTDAIDVTADEAATSDRKATTMGRKAKSDRRSDDAIVSRETFSGDIDVMQRRASSRGETAVEILLRGRGVVLATAAEADAVLRVLRTVPDETRLDPPAQGLVSFAGRRRAGLPFEIAAARDVLNGLSRYAGSLDEKEGDRIELDGSLTFASPKEASRAVERAKFLVSRFSRGGGVLGKVADSAKLTELGASVRIRLEVPFASLAELH